MKFCQINKIKSNMIQLEYLEKDGRKWDRKHNKDRIRIKSFKMFFIIWVRKKENSFRGKVKQELEEFSFILEVSFFFGYSFQEHRIKLGPNITVPWFLLIHMEVLSNTQITTHLNSTTCMHLHIQPQILTLLLQTYPNLTDTATHKVNTWTKPHTKPPHPTTPTLNNNTPLQSLAQSTNPCTTSTDPNPTNHIQTVDMHKNQCSQIINLIIKHKHLKDSIDFLLDFSKINSFIETNYLTVFLLLF